MGFIDAVKSQFIDVIEYIDESNIILVKKFGRYKNEIKQGAKLIVREGQTAIFLKGGQIADTFGPGTYSLDTKNLPVLSTLGAVGYLFNSPIKSDLYFVSTRQFSGNKWETSNPVITRDEEFGIVRVRAVGSYAFKTVDSNKFMREIFGSMHLTLTFPIIDYLTSILVQTVSETIAKMGIPVIDLALHYSDIADQTKAFANEKAAAFGIEYTNILIENISLPGEVEKAIDEQSGVGVASKNMEGFKQYESIRAMRDAAKQEGGLAGLGAGFGLGNMMANGLSGNLASESTDIKIRCTECRALNSESAKFCSQCGKKLQ